MIDRHDGCKAECVTDQDSKRYVPVCMGGVALEGVHATLAGCNDPSNCLPKVADLAEDYKTVMTALLGEDGNIRQVDIVTRASAVTPTPPQV